VSIERLNPLPDQVGTAGIPGIESPTWTSRRPRAGSSGSWGHGSWGHWVLGSHLTIMQLLRPDPRISPPAWHEPSASRKRAGGTTSPPAATNGRPATGPRGQAITLAYVTRCRLVSPRTSGAGWSRSGAFQARSAPRSIRGCRASSPGAAAPRTPSFPGSLFGRGHRSASCHPKRASSATSSLPRHLPDFSGKSGTFSAFAAARNPLSRDPRATPWRIAASRYAAS
jgi:hypothetical protein